MISILLSNLVLLGILIVCSALFSGSEAALFGLREWQVRSMVENNAANASLVKTLLSKPRRLLVAIVLWNDLINIAAASLSESFCKRYISFGSLIVSTAFIAILLLVFGEVTPKAIAMAHTKRFARVVAPVISLFCKLVEPMQRIVHGLSDALVRETATNKGKSGTDLRLAELKFLLAQSDNGDILRSKEREILDRLLTFEHIRAGELMIHRTEIKGLPETASIEDALEAITKHRFSRLPVYSGDPDHITGLVYAKDILAQKFRLAAPKSVAELTKRVLFAPEARRAVDILFDMKEQAIHAAIVVDEHGGTSGLVTLEDIVEEMVGDLYDEFDVRTENIMRTKDNAYVVLGGTDIKEFNEVLGVSIASAQNTINGFVCAQIGHFPRAGESLKYEGLDFRVLRTHNNRIVKLLVKTKPVPQTENEDTL